MGDLSKHFSRREFACKCRHDCGCDTVDSELIRCLEEVRLVINKPIRINSACRCKAHNEFVGGAKNSMHLRGKAADIVVAGMEASRVQSLIDNMFPGRYGLGRYKGFTHFDVRGETARWKG